MNLTILKQAGTTRLRGWFFLSVNLLFSVSVHTHAAEIISCNKALSGIIPEGTKVILAANRLPVTVRVEEGKVVTKLADGGLAAALRSTDENFIWVGWTGHEIADQDKRAVSSYLETFHPRLNLQPVFLSHQERQGFYIEYSNRVIWPIFHGLDHAHEAILHWETYQTINKKFATKIFSVIKRLPQDQQVLVWVHDYQLMLVPQILKRLLNLEGMSDRVKIGFFLHIPWPADHEFSHFPNWQRNALLNGMLGADQVGFQTPNDMKTFVDALQLQDLRAGNTFLGVYPVGIDPNSIRALKEKRETQVLIDSLEEEYKDYQLIFGMERLDPSKGLIQKLEAYEIFLDKNPDMVGKTVFLQVVQPSRMEIPEYRKLHDELITLEARINSRFAKPGRLMPITVVRRGFSPTEWVAHFSVASVIVINPLRDGMNLVSFESRVAQFGRSKPASLILSRRAGAAAWLLGASTVDPTDTGELANAYQQGLEMDTTERVQRNQTDLQHIEKESAREWMRRAFRDIYMQIISPNILVTESALSP